MNAYAWIVRHRSRAFHPNIPVNHSPAQSTEGCGRGGGRQFHWLCLEPAGRESPMTDRPPSRFPYAVAVIW